MPTRLFDRVGTRWIVFMVVCALVAGTSACAMRHSTAVDDTDPMVVTEDQIAELHAATAYEIVSKTHGDFLHSRGRESLDPRVPPTPVGVYVDDTFYGDVGTLRGIAAGDVQEIHFWQSYEAQYRFGSGHLGGVIQVITKR